MAPHKLKIVLSVVSAILRAGYLDVTFVWKQFFILRLSITLSHFHKSSQNLLKEVRPIVYFFAFYTPKNDQRWTLIRI